MVWLNRDDKTNETDIAPDYQIRSLAEIKGILELRIYGLRRGKAAKLNN
ncbi:MAG: hypothetical protein HQ568_07360 [Calditrichaeota bacterium]|nr:hypothetical protein [Calditrichota bacterium]